MASITPKNGRVAFVAAWDPHTYWELNSTNLGTNFGDDDTGNDDNTNVASGDISTQESYDGMNNSNSPQANGRMDTELINDACALVYIPAGLAHGTVRGLFDNGSGTNGQGAFLRATTTGVEIAIGHNNGGQTSQDCLIEEIPDADLPGWFCIGWQYNSHGGTEGDMALWLNGTAVRSGTRVYTLDYGAGNPGLGSCDTAPPDAAACLDPASYGGGDWGSSTAINGTGILIANFTCDNPSGGASDTSAGNGNSFHTDYYDDHVEGGAVTASGTVTAAAVTATPTVTVIRPASGTVTAAQITATGTGSLGATSANGAVTLDAVTASATLQVTRKANGTPSIAAVTVAAQLNRPRVWLNTTETKTGATEMTVTAFNDAGTSITFTDPAGSPTGSLKLGVERFRDGELAWIDVTVTSDQQTASGAVSIASPTVSATLSITRKADGTPSIAAITNTGTLLLTRHASGSPSISQVTATGTASLGAKTASGNPILAAITPTGTLLLTHGASGTPSLAQATASGTASVGADITASGAITLASITASGISNTISGSEGTPTLEAVTGAGTLVLTHPASGTPDIAAVTATGQASVGGVIAANGNPQTAPITATAALKLTRPASATPTLAAITATGVASKGAVTSSGAVNLATITATATLQVSRQASGTPITAAITASGTTSIGGVIAANGNPQLAAVTASGAIKTTRKASAAPSLLAMAASVVLALTHPASGVVTLPSINASGNIATNASTMGRVVELTGRADVSVELTGLFDPGTDATGKHDPGITMTAQGDTV